MRGMTKAISPATLRKYSRIRAILAQLNDGLTVREVGKALGMSRQLALYHLKRMVALGQLVMVLEPCVDNGAVRYRCWDELALAGFYSRKLHATIVMTSEQRRAA